MKQKEKLDLILKALYRNRHFLFSSLEDIIAELKIPIDSNNEIQNLAKRLEEERYIRIKLTKDCSFATITSYGIEYCEEDLSFSRSTYSVNNTFNIQNISESPNSNIISNSSKTNITIQNYPEIENIIKEIQDAILETKEISKTERENLEELLKDITTSLKEGQNPKFSIQKLLSNAGNFSSIGQLVIQLGQLISFK